MMHSLIDFLIFLIETAVVIVAILITAAGIIAILNKGKSKEKTQIKVKKLNKYYYHLSHTIKTEILSKKERKKRHKIQKKKAKKEFHKKDKRIFVINFKGDIKATAVSSLREEITSILCVATPSDEVVLRLESTGGIIHGYGLAASELARLRDRKIPLTVIVDKVAASGGYMMACVADKILAAPFAIIGSIGVIAQLPNFHRLLKKHDIDFEQISAGEYKRTLTLFGENTHEGRQKFQEEVNEAHHLFKAFIQQYRPQVNLEKVSTGEYWFAQKAIELKLVDQIITSDDYLLSASERYKLYEITYKKKKKFAEKIGMLAQTAVEKTVSGLKQTETDEIFF